MDAINIIGLGYIGLPTALMFASSGVKVIGTDCDETIIDNLKHSRMPFEEDGLRSLFDAAKDNDIYFTTECASADYYIIAVPTPFDKDTRMIDTQYVEHAIEDVIAVCPDEATIIIESTVAPGTIHRYIRPIAEKSGKQIHLSHAPERIIPGQMLYELTNNSRTIGVDDEESGRRIRELYSNFCRGEIIITDIKTAEMTKVVENTYRDINIAFANELATICREDDMDVYEIIRIANKHPRVDILSPGPGVGGHCIAVDPWFLVGRYPQQAKLIRQAREVNASIPEQLSKRIDEIMEENAISSYSRVGLYGLTYKENVNDIRESPTMQMMALHNSKSHIYNVYDPYVTTGVVDGQYFDFDDFLDNSDMVVVMVAHDEIKSHVYQLKEKVVLDTRNIVHNAKKLYRL